MQWYTLFPTVPQRAHRPISVDDVVQQRRTEQREHREIGLAVAAVRGRVDHDDTRRGPHDVPRPQVAVDARGRVGVVEHPVGHRTARALDVCRVRGGDVARVDRGSEERQNTFGDVERTPRGMFDAGHRPRADEHLTRETLRRTTGSARACAVCAGKLSTEPAGGGAGRRRRNQPFQFDVSSTDVQDVHHGCSPVAKPLQSSGFRSEEIRVCTAIGLRIRIGRHRAPAYRPP